MALDRESFSKRAREDFEFTRETRYFTGSIKLEMGDEVWALDFKEGELLNVGDTAQADPRIVVGGTADQWDALLEEKPRPFYQCIQSAAVKEGMRISDTNETFAYLPALNRMTTLMRQLKAGRG